MTDYRRKEREIEEEEEAYERRKLEKKLREKEAAYQEVCRVSPHPLGCQLVTWLLKPEP